MQSITITQKSVIDYDCPMSDGCWSIPKAKYLC